MPEYKLGNFVSIDIETTGLDPEQHDVIEIGAVIDNWRNPLDYRPTFHCYIRRDQYTGQAGALSMHQEIFWKLAHRHENPADRFYHPGNAITALGNFLRKNGAYNRPMIDGGKITAAGKNFGSFDLQFLKRMPRWKENVRCYQRFLDPGIMFWNPAEDAITPDLRTCLHRAGMPDEVKHTALDDACQVADLIIYAANKLSP